MLLLVIYMGWTFSLIPIRLESLGLSSWLLIALLLAAPVLEVSKVENLAQSDLLFSTKILMRLTIWHFVGRQSVLFVCLAAPMLRTQLVDHLNFWLCPWVIVTVLSMFLSIRVEATMVHGHESALFLTVHGYIVCAYRVLLIRSSIEKPLKHVVARVCLPRRCLLVCKWLLVVRNSSV